MHNTREEAKIKPIKFSRDLAPLDGEVFKNVKAPELKGIYKISNYCRIKRLKHHHKGREHREMILTPFRNLKNDNAKFRLIIRDVSYNVQDLMYDAFKGLPLGKVAMPKDGDNRNLCMDNMKAVNSTWSHIEKHIKEKTAKTQSTPKEITVNLNTGDKAEKIKEMNALRKKGYVLKSSSNGVYEYYLKLKKQ